MTRKDIDAEWARLKKARITISVGVGKEPKPMVSLDRRQLGELLRRTYSGGFNEGAEWMKKRLRR